jgi:hypothetical protein
MRTVKWCIVLMALLSVSATAATAGTGTLLNVKLEEVTIVPQPVGTPPQIQKPGNMQVKIQGGFKPPSGVSCEGTYITTLAGADPDRLMFQLLITAAANGLPVHLGITDDPQYNAFPGNCSLMFVSLLKKP